MRPRRASSIRLEEPRQIHRQSKAIQRETCFVLMPFKPDSDELYSRTIKPTVERLGTLRCLRADEIYGPRPIIADIWRSIRKSKLVVAELTSRNPNVFYELGLAHAIQKPVILLSQDENDVPFDLRHVRVIIYSNTEQGRKELQIGLRRTLHALMEEFEKPSFGELYAVLETEEHPKAPPGKGVKGLLRSLNSKEPSDIISGLTRIVSTFGERRKPKNCDPQIIEAILPHLESRFPEIQLTAIQALAAAGDPVHAQKLQRFLSADNPILVETAIAALGEIGGPFTACQLLDTFRTTTYGACRLKILEALTNLDPAECVSLCAKVATDNNRSLQERSEAIQILGNMQELSAIDALLKLDVDIPDVELRRQLAKTLLNVESPFQPMRIKELETQLTRLVSDSSPEVRGWALAAWCVHSSRHYSGSLDRSFLWTRLETESADALFEFFSSLEDYETALGFEESGKLVDLAQRHPAIYDSVVFLLGKIGDKSVVEFMIEAYREARDNNQLWVLSYLSKCPSERAVDFLREEIERDRQIEQTPIPSRLSFEGMTLSSRVSLAAMALSRLGMPNMVDLLLKQSSNSFPWVQARVGRYLQELLPFTSSEKKQEKMMDAIRRLLARSKGF